MSEFSRQSHEREPVPRPVTGLFQLHVSAPIEFSADGKAKVSRGEPRFAVKDVMVLHTSEGWREFTDKLISLLGDEEKKVYQDFAVYSVAQGPMEELTDGMSSDEIRIVSTEEYARAHTNKYGDAIYVPTFW